MPSPSLAHAWKWPSAHPKPQLPTYHASSSISSSSQLAVAFPHLRVLRRSGSRHSVSSSTSKNGRSWGSGGPGLHSCLGPVTGRHAGLGAAARRSRHSRVSSSSSSSPAQPCSLHACLEKYGIIDLAVFSAPKHMALSQAAVSTIVEPKLAALEAEGLSHKQMAGLMGHKSHSLLCCSYTETFQPNLQLVRQIAAYSNQRPHPKTLHLTAAGKILAGSPAATIRYLPRDPSKVQQLLQWLEGSLGVGLQQLAACNNPCNALQLSADAASEVSVFLQRQQVPVEQVAQMLLMHPSTFSYKPQVWSARMQALQQHLDLDTAAALQVAVALPTVLAKKLETRLPPLLLFLESYMGEEGAGRRLVCARLSLAGATASDIGCSIASLAARGYTQQEIRTMISKDATLFQTNLASPLQRQKLDWIDRVSPWTLADFLGSPRYYNTTTRRLAGRLALLRACGLQAPPLPGVQAVYNGFQFLQSVKEQLTRKGRELPWASWPEWESEWLGTGEGREWGFPSIKN